MTIGIAVSGPMAGLAAFMALRAVEHVARGAVGGFVSFVVLSDEDQLLAAKTQRGGTATLFTESEATGTLPPPAFATARLAGLMSSGPNRPEPLIQFTPSDPTAGIVTGHRLPNMPGSAGVPLNLAVLERLRRGEMPRAAVEAELAANPRADAGIIALARDGSLYAADSALVSRRDDRGSYLGEDAKTGARCAVLHNSIFPVAPLAPLAAAIAFDAMAPADQADFHVTVAAGTPLALGEESCLQIGAGGRVSQITVADPIWLGGCHHGAALPHGAAVWRDGQLIGRVIFEPYCVVENGILRSLSGLDEAIVAVRADAIEGTKDHRALR